MKKNNKLKQVKKAPQKSKKSNTKVVSKTVSKTSTSKSVQSSQNSIGLQPLADRVVVKALSPEESGTLTAFGIVMPDSSKEKPEQGTVMALGPGKRLEDGTLTEMSVKVGDRVMFSKYGFDEIKVGGVEYLILPESSILAVIEQ